MCFQKNAWVDSEITIALAKDFAQRTRIKHGDFWVLLNLDNISAHCNAEVKLNYWEGKVFLCYLCSQPTEFT